MLESKRRRPSSDIVREARIAPGSFRLSNLRSEHLELPDPIRMLLATAKVYRNLATLSTGPTTAVLCAAAVDLERHAEHLTMVSGRDDFEH